MKKRFLIFCLLGCICGVSLNSMYCICEAYPVVSGLVAEVNYDIEPRADILEWRFKSVNGKIYKRLYNFTRQEWVGKWIEVK